jgi:hypothetical protein
MRVGASTPGNSKATRVSTGVKGVELRHSQTGCLTSACGEIRVRPPSTRGSLTMAHQLRPYVVMVSPLHVDQMNLPNLAELCRRHEPAGASECFGSRVRLELAVASKPPFGGPTIISSPRPQELCFRQAALDSLPPSLPACSPCGRRNLSLLCCFYATM